MLFDCAKIECKVKQIIPHSALFVKFFCSQIAKYIKKKAFDYTLRTSSLSSEYIYFDLQLFYIPLISQYILLPLAKLHLPFLHRPMRISHSVQV